LTTTAPRPYNATLALKQGDLGSLLRIVRDNVPAHVSGVTSGKIDVAGRLGKPERVVVDLESAQLDIQGQSFRTRGPTHMALEKGQLTISPLSLHGEEGVITVGGTIGKDIDLKIAGAAPAALATLVSPDIRDATGILDLDMTIQGSQKVPQYRGHVRTNDASLTLQVHPDPIQDLQGEIRFTEAGVETDGLKARWGGGKIDAKLQGRPEQHGWEWKVQFKLEDARVERIFVITEGGEKTPMGVGPLQASGDITAGNATEFVASLGGRLRIEMVNGVIHRSFSLQKALSLINLSFLFTKGPDEKGLPYDQISMTWDLEKGIAKTDDMKLLSPVLRVAGVGQLDLPQQTIDAHMAVQPLKLTDSVIKAVSSVPIIKQVGIGTLLFGKDKSIMVVAYRIEGPITDPEVTKVPTKVVDTGILGLVGKSLELPADTLTKGSQEPAKEEASQEPAKEEASPDPSN
jgi:hypothetical protein